MPFFKVDPYPYKKFDENGSKEDSEFLQNLFNKSKIEIFEASNAYNNNSDGLRSFIFITRSYEHIRTIELSDQATSLAVAIIIFAIEGIMNHIPKPKHNKPTVNELRFIKYLNRCLTRTDKLQLLNSLVFSAKSKKSIPMTRGTSRHVMYKGMIRKCKSDRYEVFTNEWCTASEETSNIHCNCINWLSGESDLVINYYLRKIARHLYKMRCSIVHDGIAPIITYTDEKPKSVAFWGMTVSDVYFDNKYSKHYKYESSLSRQRLETIFVNSLWLAFQKGYPRKKY